MDLATTWRQDLQVKRDPKQPGQYLLETGILLPESLDRVFAFFADAYELETITPPWLQFHVLSERPIRMQLGQLIDYRLKLRGIPVRWQSEITAWEPPYRFVDEQVRGPYRRWHHEHTFENHPDGTLVGDRVEYAVPGGWLVNSLFVKRDLEKIFRFRHEKLREIFSA
jgi:ligand-binding SRPBCC domain-containing protein